VSEESKVTSPEPQQRSALEKEEEQWVAPPLEPLEIKVVMSIFALLGILLFARQFYPAPEEAHRSVGFSFFVASTGAGALVRSQGKWRSNVPVAVAAAFAVVCGLLSAYVGIMEPHRLIPWFLHPFVMLFAQYAVAMVAPIPHLPLAD
jgi:membrane-bound metal-dependent hydrolase YbcI (DUF457 family)